MKCLTDRHASIVGRRASTIDDAALTGWLGDLSFSYAAFWQRNETPGGLDHLVGGNEIEPTVAPYGVAFEAGVVEDGEDGSGANILGADIALLGGPQVFVPKGEHAGEVVPEEMARRRPAMVYVFPKSFRVDPIPLVEAIGIPVVDLQRIDVFVDVDPYFALAGE